MDKRSYIFPKGLNPKENVIARPEFELVYYDVAVQHINQYATRVLLKKNIEY